jgi:hypothetical protein
VASKKGCYFFLMFPLESNHKQIFRWATLKFIYSQTMIALCFKFL